LIVCTREKYEGNSCNKDESDRLTHMAMFFEILKKWRVVETARPTIDYDPCG
jgi:hypothetical protein